MVNHLGAGAFEPGGALKLLAMMMGKKNPFDALDANIL